MKSKLVFKTPKDKNFFFGYYDKSPINSSSDLLLAQETKFIDREVSDGDMIKIGFFKFRESDTFYDIAETSAWNWQMGSMLQWLGPNYDDEVIFNDVENNKFISRKLSLSSGNETKYEIPIYAVSPNGDYALCVDYERLYWHRRGYNYQGVINLEKKALFDPNDAIWKLDFATGAIKKILSFKEISDLDLTTSMKQGANYLEHLMISPNSEEFIFYHRWILEDGIHTRALISGSDGSNLRILNDTGRMSHVYWRNNKSLIGFGSTPNYLLNIRKNSSYIRKYLFKPLLPIFHRALKTNTSIRNSITGDGYYLFDSSLKKKSEKIVHDSLITNGHPSFHPYNKDIFVTDIYPETNNHKPKLTIFNLKKNESFLVDTLKSIEYLDETPMRCDLHPKWSFDGNYISVDTQNDGCRSIYLYKFEE